MARRRYDIWVRDDGYEYIFGLTMDECHECDNLCSGMIEQVAHDVILWHDIETENDVKAAFKWLYDNISCISTYMCEVSFTTYIVTADSTPLTEPRIYHPSWIDTSGMIHWDVPAGGIIGERCIDCHTV